MQLEPLEHALRIPTQGLELLGAPIRSHQLDELDLIELVLADQPARVLAARARLRAEARRVRGQPDREVRGVEDLIHVEVGDLDLGGRRQEQIMVGILVGPDGELELEQVRLELRQLPGAAQRRAPHDRRWPHLGVAMRRVEIEHVVDERAGQLRCAIAEHGEPRPGDPRAGLEVEDAEALADLPVRLRREAIRGLVAPGVEDRVVLLAGARRPRGVRRVR